MIEETLGDLRRINEQLPIEENAGNRSFFEDRLAPVFVLRRANGEIQNRDTFLSSLKPGGERVCDPGTIEIQSLGASRALVTCAITIGTQRIHNARLFAKNARGHWELLCWANEYL